MKRSANSLLPWLAALACGVLFFWLVIRLAGVLTPFVVAAVLAYILDPLVGWLTRHRVGRPLASLLVMAGGMLLISLLLLVVVPMLIEQAQALAARLPAFIDFVQHRFLPWLDARFGVKIVLNADTWRAALSDKGGALRQALEQLWPQLTHGGAVLFDFLSNMVLLPLLLYYFLLDWPRMCRWVATLVPRRWAVEVGRVAGELDQVLGEFLRGQISVMLIMAAVYGGGLMLTGLESGLAIGIVAGLLVFIPYLGAFIGLLLATLAALLQFGTLSGLALVWGVFMAGQTLESFVVTPYLVGERIGLSPMAVIFALMAFGQLMGFTGVLLALPLAAIVMVLARSLLARYFTSRFYQRKIGR
ncbi:AI-2E family transporter [Crenobacter intestini]|uniref:AI-2E family transporter n=1 Tax=Crenobacter intestini TaxID=2563443 RepID=A0A4T0ULD3_9NEIS|nr:AI-2E family transporter [Crenobacter intestini]TIC79221.1 AI-2E family transporter [Crenobacter intestini]